MRTLILASALLLSAAPVLAQYQDRPYYAEHGEENVSYGYAQVLRVDPVYEIERVRVPEERCDGEAQQDSTTDGTIVGAIVGAAIGNQVGRGDGRRAATVAGAVAGAAVGRNVDRNMQAGPGCRIVEVEREERHIAGYDVEYQYKGEKYMSHLPYDPGNRLRVRVSVMPDDSGTASR